MDFHELMVQDNHSWSKFGVVQGLHVQPGMGKLITCLQAQITMDLTVTTVESLVHMRFRMALPLSCQWQWTRVSMVTLTPWNEHLGYFRVHGSEYYCGTLNTVCGQNLATMGCPVQSGIAHMVRTLLAGNTMDCWLDAQFKVLTSG